MESSIPQPGHIGPIARKLMMALALIVLSSGVFAPQAMAERHDVRGRGGYDHRDHRDWHGRGHPYGYAQPVYVPPPAYYQPAPSPGISLFFPLDLRR